VNSLCTGRRCERTAVRVVTMLRGHKVYYVYGNRRNFNGFVLLLRNVLPERFQKRIGSTDLEQDGDNGEVAVRVGVDQMPNHIEALPKDMLLTGMVEMKLFEGIGLVADCEGAAWRVVNHDGVAVVDDA